MNLGLVAGGVIGAAALGTLLYRTYRRETEPPGRKAASARGTMSPFQSATAGARSEARPGTGRNMRTPLTAPEADAAMHPPRVSRWFLILPPAILLGLMLLALLLRGDYRIAATLGIVQGLGEPLPISSSAHLIITPWLFGWNDPDGFYNSQTYDVALHVGTLLALVGFFWRDWLQLLRGATQPKTPDGRLFWLIVIASVPGAAIGFVLDRFAADFFRDKYLVIAAALAIMGVVLYLADKLAPQRVELDQLDWRNALMIGLAQALAFVPGVSRSGSTMTMGRVLGLRRETSARFSFLIAMPITFGAALLKLKDVELAALRLPAFWLGIAMSFVVGVLAIGFLLRYLRQNSYVPFVVYRLGLAALIVAVYFLRG